MPGGNSRKSDIDNPSEPSGTGRRRPRADGAPQALGYRNVITLPEEGASLRAAGFKLVTDRAGGGPWSSGGRRAAEPHPLVYQCR